jgi:hypothetical protein
MTPQDQLETLRSDPANWTPSGFYRCAADPRLMVERRIGIGYTINIAHHRSWLIFVGLIVVALAPTAVNVTLGSRAPDWLLVASLLLPITLSVVTLTWLMRRAKR